MAKKIRELFPIIPASIVVSDNFVTKEDYLAAINKIKNPCCAEHLAIALMQHEEYQELYN